MAAPHELYGFDVVPSALQPPASANLTPGGPVVSGRYPGAAEVLTQLDTLNTQPLPWEDRLRGRLKEPDWAEVIPMRLLKSGADLVQAGLAAAVELDRQRGQASIHKFLTLPDMAALNRLTKLDEGMSIGTAYHMLPALAVGAMFLGFESQHGRDNQENDRRIQEACAEIAAGTYRPPKQRQPKPVSLANNAKASLQEWYKGDLDPTSLAVKIERLSLFYVDEPGGFNLDALIADLRAGGYTFADSAVRQPNFSMITQRAHVNRNSWLQGVYKLNGQAQRHRISQVLVDALAEGRTTLTDLLRLAHDRVGAAAESKLTPDEIPDIKLLRDLDQASRLLGLKVRDATKDALMQLEHGDEPEEEVAETQPGVRQPRVIDPFRVLTLARLHQAIPGSRLIFKFRDPAREIYYQEHPEETVRLDEIFGTIVLQTAEGDAVTEDLYGGATLVWRHETGLNKDPIVTWDRIKHDRQKARDQGAVRIKHPNRKDIDADHRDMLTKYVALILQDLHTPLNPGEVLRSYRILQTINALGNIALGSVRLDQ